MFDEEIIKSSDINLSKILKKYPNRFLLSIAVSKRARQIQEGAKPRIPVDTTKHFSPTLVALKEIEEDHIKIVMKNEDDAEIEVLEKMDQILKSEIEEEEEEETKKDKKKDTKESKSKQKSKSLAA